MRATGGDPARAAPLLAELIAKNVDVLIPVGEQVTRAAHAATTSIPIVTFDLNIDPIESGLIKSLARPGGNVTGVFLDFPEFSTTWLTLLKEAVPNLRNIIVVWDPSTSDVQPKAVAAAAHRLNIKIAVMELKTASELETVFEAASARHPDGLLMLTSPLTSIYSKQIAELTLKYRLPAISSFASFARAGGLIGYGPNLHALYREVGIMVGKVLMGTKPADLPAELPTRFELAVNLTAAKTLNLTLPNSLLARADEVIE